MNVLFLKDVNSVKKCLNSFESSLESLSQGKEFIDNISNKFVENGNVMAIMDADVYVAFVAFYSNDTINKIAYLSMIAVNPDYRRRGFGKTIFEHMIKYCVTCGMNKIKLEVRKNNYSAVALYEKIGFKFICDSSENKAYMEYVFNKEMLK